MKYKMGFCMTMVMVLFYFTFSCEENSGDWTAGESIIIKLKEHANLKSSGFSLKFEEIVHDSRCPLKTNCADNGQVEIAVIVIDKLSIAGTFNMTLRENETNQPSFILGEYKITLLDVSPLPNAQIEAQNQDYQIVVQVDQI